MLKQSKFAAVITAAALVFFTAGPVSFAQVASSTAGTSAASSGSATGNGTSTSAIGTGTSTGAAGSNLPAPDLTAGTGTSTASSTKINITISENAFTPTDIGITAGTTLTWTNYGAMTHTVTADNGSFDSGDLGPGSSFSHTFNTPGIYNYYDRYHGGTNNTGMSGIVTVTTANPDNSQNGSSGNGITSPSASTLSPLNNTAGSGTGSTSASTTLLNAPANLTATATSPTQINLTWSPAAGPNGVAGYVVFRDGSQIATPSGTTYSDTELTPSTTYTYMVSAFDSSGNSSIDSSSTTATTLPGASSTTSSSTLAAPTNLVATAISPTEIDLSWSAPVMASSLTSTIAGYTVYRDNIQIGTASTTSFSDANLSPSTAYSYTVAATDSANNVSAQSEPATATTGTGTSSTTPPVITPPANGIWGWLAIPLNLYNQLYGNASTSSSSTGTNDSGVSYTNGYPTVNGNYIDCNGNIDNDPAHHTTNPSDTDPAHHVGQNCPAGSLTIPNEGNSGTANTGSIFSLFAPGNNGQLAQWVIVPLTGDLIGKLSAAANAGGVITNGGSNSGTNIMLP